MLRVDAGTARGRDAHQQVSAVQQGVDMLGTQRQPRLLGTDQAIFHDVGDADPGIDSDNPRRALERVRGTHAGFQLIGLLRITLQRQQPRAEYLGLRFGLQGKQLEQRGVAHLLGGHVRLRVTADST